MHRRTYGVLFSTLLIIALISFLSCTTQKAASPAKVKKSISRTQVSQRPAQRKKAQIDRRLRRRPQISEDKIRVVAVTSGSASEAAGLLPGDIILSFDRRPVSSPKKFVEAVNNARQGRHLISYKRNGARKATVVLLPSSGTRPRLGIEIAGSKGGGRFNSAKAKSPTNKALLDATRRVQHRPSPLISKRMKEINVLRYAFLDPETNSVTFMGTYDPAYASGPIDYQNLLADALENPYPEFSLDHQSGKDAAERVVRFMDQEMKRISTDVDYGIKWMTRTVMPILNSRDSIPERLIFEHRMKRDLGIEPEEFRAYLDFDPKSKTLNPAEYSKMGRFLGKIFKAVGVEERFGRAFAAFSQMQKEYRLGKSDFNTTLKVVGLLGVTDQFQRIRNDFNSKRITADAAGRRIFGLIYGALLKGMGVAPSRVDALTMKYRKGIGFDEALAAELERRYETLTKEALLLHVFNVMVFSQDFLRGLYPGLPFVQTGVRLYGRRADSPLARVMFDADYALKYLSSLNPETLSIRGHKSSLEFLTAEAEARNRSVPKQARVRKWIEPSGVKMKAFSDNTGIRFDTVSLRIGAEPLETSGQEGFLKGALDRYAEGLSRRYDDYARLYPSLHVMRETAKIIALAQWLKDKHLQVALPSVVPVKNPVPDRVKGFVSIVFMRKAQGDSDSLFLDMDGGVDFSDTNTDAWVQVQSDPEATKDVIQQLSGSTVLAEQAAEAALEGNLEGARDLAEKSAQAMTGAMGKGELAQTIPVPKPSPAAVSVPVGTQAAVSEATVEALDRNVKAMKDVKKQLAAAESFKKTSPDNYRRGVSSAQTLQRNSEANLRHLKELLAAYRGQSVSHRQIIADLRGLDPSRPPTVALLRPSSGPTPAPSSSKPSPDIEELIPSRKAYLEELKSLRRDFDRTKAVLGRLTQYIQANLRLRKEWEQEAEAATSRAEERAKSVLKQTLNDTVFGFLKAGAGNSPNRIRELEQLQELMDLNDLAEWARADRHEWEDIAQQLVSALQEKALGPQARVVVSSVENIINSAYDITAWFTSWRTIQQVNKSDKKYAVAVKGAAEHMKSISKRIKEVEEKLGATRGGKLGISR